APLPAGVGNGDWTKKSLDSAPALSFTLVFTSTFSTAAMVLKIRRRLVLDHIRLHVRQECLPLGQGQPERFHCQLLFRQGQHFTAFLCAVVPYADHFNAEVHRHHLRCCIKEAKRSFASLRLNRVGVSGPVRSKRSSTLFQPVVTASSKNCQSMS